MKEKADPSIANALPEIMIAKAIPMVFKCLITVRFKIDDFDMIDTLMTFYGSFMLQLEKNLTFLKRKILQKNNP